MSRMRVPRKGSPFKHPTRGVVRVTRRQIDGFFIKPWDPEHPRTDSKEPETFVFRSSFEHRSMTPFIPNERKTA